MLGIIILGIIQGIAEFLHIKQNTYSQYETGQRQLPVDTLIKLALFFNTSTDYILELTDEAKPYRRTGRQIKGEEYVF